MTEIICYYTEHPGFDIVDHYQFESDPKTFKELKEYINTWAKNHFVPTLDEDYNPIQDHIKEVSLKLDGGLQRFSVIKPYKD